jgi:hypothetical protein
MQLTLCLVESLIDPSQHPQSVISLLRAVFLATIESKHIKRKMLAKCTRRAVRLSRSFSNYRGIQRASEDPEWEKPQPDRQATQISINYGRGIFEKGSFADKVKEKIQDYQEEARAYMYGTGLGQIGTTEKECVNKNVWSEAWSEENGNYTTTKMNAFSDDNKDWAQIRHELGQATVAWDQDAYKIKEDRQTSYPRMGQEKAWREGTVNETK